MKKSISKHAAVIFISVTALFSLYSCASTSSKQESLNDAEAYYNRGVDYYQNGEYDQAIADFSEAIRLDPTMAMAYSNRGAVYLYKGDYDWETA